MSEAQSKEPKFTGAHDELISRAKKCQCGICEACEYAESCDRSSNLVALLRSARCPNGRCDNNGTITVYLGEGMGVEQEQCQWCYERDAAIRSTDETPAAQNMHSDEWWQAELDRCVAVEQAKYRALFDAYAELKAGDPEVTAGVRPSQNGFGST